MKHLINTAIVMPYSLDFKPLTILLNERTKNIEMIKNPSKTSV